MQKETKDSFLSDTRNNPKDCMTIILRSGRELDDMRGENRDTEEEKQEEIAEELEQYSPRTTKKNKTTKM